MEWWIYEDGEPSSRPYTKQELRSLVDIDPETRVRARDGTFRIPAREVPELEDLFSESTSDGSQEVSRESFDNLLQQAQPPPPEKGEPVRKSPDFLDRFRHEKNRFRFEHLLTNPFLFFRRLDPDGSNLFALVFALSVMLVGRFFVVTYASLIPGYQLPIQSLLQSINPGEGPVSLLLIPYFLIVLPLILTLVLLVGAVFFHGLIALFGWNETGFPATFKVCCYTSVSGLAQTLPLMGGGIASVWGLVLFVIGMMEVQGLSVTKAILLSLFPVLLTAVMVSLGYTL